ncbi:MAG: acyl carrier protein [Candidatus Omnitrophica bacterium]|nr:acyl carrier protein [Candidatus Omnitrophota bacterium]
MAESGKSINVEKDMRALVAEILETEPDQLDLSAKFVKDLGMDSMMALEILAGIEKKYRIVIPEDMLSKFTDLEATVKLVTEILVKNKKI